MKRTIISIDEGKCTGCGQCIPGCPEGALQVIDGKARLVSDFFCDGLGACIGECPEGAIAVIEREAAPYDEAAVMERIAAQGAPVIRAHLEHLARHGQRVLYNEAIEFLLEHNRPIPDHEPPERRPRAEGQGGHSVSNTRDRKTSPGSPPAPVPSSAHGPRPFAGCPGAAPRSIPREDRPAGRDGATGEGTGSELRQWPVQLALLDPAAPYFENADLLIAADCVPFAYAGFHAEFLRGKIVIIFCPRLDPDPDAYIDKLAEIVARHAIRSITVLHMEVPCCSGVRYVVDKALGKAGKKIPVEEKTITIAGNVR